MLINVTAERIIAKPGSIIYNVLDDSSESVVKQGVLQLEEKQVVVGVFNDSGNQFIMRSTTDIDGGKSSLLIPSSLIQP